MVSAARLKQCIAVKLEVLDDKECGGNPHGEQEIVSEELPRTI